MFWVSGSGCALIYNLEACLLSKEIAKCHLLERATMSLQPRHYVDLVRVSPEVSRVGMGAVKPQFSGRNVTLVSEMYHLE